MPRGKLGKVIEVVKKKMKLSDVYISPETIRCREKVGNLITVSEKVSPMADVKHWLCEMFVHLGEIRCPVSSSEGLCLANAWIRDKHIEKIRMKKLAL